MSDHHWQATILTLFPEMFPGPLGVSLLGKALANGLWSLDVRDIREHGLGKHRTVDDSPAGGGPGMVMRADVAAAAIDAVERGDRPLIYAAVRLLPGVLGAAASTEEESFAAGLLEYPQFTRPQLFEGAPIPEVLS